MKIIQPSVEVEEFDAIKMLCKIEKAGRTCYKSESKITPDSAEKFIRNIIRRGHESVLEHEKISTRIICDRGVTHELVRHRCASYSQESTRYVSYKEGIEVIDPCFWKQGTLCRFNWIQAMLHAEASYKKLIERGASPQEARTVLPNSLKTEVVVTMNLRAWRNFFELRCPKSAHPQMRQIAFMLLEKMSKKLSVVFDDIVEEFVDGTRN